MGVPIEALGAFLDRWASMLARIVAALVIAVHARSAGRSSTGWLLIAAGQACWAFGDSYFAIALWDADPMPFPSPGGCGLGRSLLPHPGRDRAARPRAHDRPHRVDLAARRGHRSPRDQRRRRRARLRRHRRRHRRVTARTSRTNLAYPLGDLAVVAIMVGGLAMSGWRFCTRLDSADGRYRALRGIRTPRTSSQIANGTYQRGIVDAGWVVSAAVIALAVRQPSAVTRVRVQNWSAFVFPASLRCDRTVRARLRPLPPCPPARARARRRVCRRGDRADVTHLPAEPLR